MTNPTNSSPTRTSPPDNRKEANLKRVEALVAAHPFKEVLLLPPEEVLEWFRGRVGQAVLQGLSEWKRQSQEGLLHDARHATHNEAVDKLYIAAGVDEVCTYLLRLPEEVKKYLDQQRKSKEK
jgi:hypothetical protein